MIGNKMQKLLELCDCKTPDELNQKILFLKEQELKLKQKVKNLYCPDFECDIEYFCVILPSKYIVDFDEMYIYNNFNWLRFSDTVNEPLFTESKPTHWSADTANIFDLE